MINKLLQDINSIDEPILNAMKIGVVVAFIMCLISIAILFVHMLSPISYTTYEIGTLLFKNGLFCFVDIFICGFICDKLRKQKI